jgi:transposase
LIFYVDEAGVGLLPSVRRTYAPKGKTPVITHKCRYSHYCLVSAICEKGEIFWQKKIGAYKGSHIAQFLSDLLAFAKQKILVIWDGAGIHKSQEVKELLAGLKNKELWLERIPPYSPELNADEQVWNYLKSVLLKNSSAHNLKELDSNIEYAMGIIEESPSLISSFFKHPDVGYFKF